MADVKQERLDRGASERPSADGESVEAVIAGIRLSAAVDGVMQLLVALPPLLLAVREAEKARRATGAPRFADVGPMADPHAQELADLRNVIVAYASGGNPELNEMLSNLARTNHVRDHAH